MSCERCTTVASLNFNGNKVYIFSQVQELIDKVADVLKDKKYKIINFDKAIEVKVDCFERMIVDLKDCNQLIDLEYSDIQILPLEGLDLNPSCLYNAKSLKMWISINKSTELVTILENKALTTHFQPIIEANTGKIYAYETLIRGIRENGDIMPPFEMFKMAKDSNLIFNLDRQARETNISNAYKNDIKSKIFINFTPTAIYDPEYCLKTTMETIKKFNIAPERIVFEVIETEDVLEISHLNKILDYYRKEGFKVALDDLGSGYASLNRLANLKPDYVKVDMDIIRDIHKDKLKQSIFNAIINIAKDADIITVAEGIESKEELDFVVDGGADLIQGYYYSKPLKSPLEREWI